MNTSTGARSHIANNERIAAAEFRRPPEKSSLSLQTKNLNQSPVGVSALTGADDFLSSWKEIAVFMGRGVRTVQRWEQHLALPVYRPNNSPQSIVFARKPELLQWVNSREKTCFTNTLKKLLLVENDYEIKIGLRSALEQAGFLVFSCQDKFRAEVIVRDGPGIDMLVIGPTLVPIELQVLTSLLRGLHPDLPICTSAREIGGGNYSLSKKVQSTVTSETSDDWHSQVHEVVLFYVSGSRFGKECI